MKQMLLAFPKMRGFKSHYEKATTVTLGQLEKIHASPITIVSLKRAGIASREARLVKVVLGGALTKPLHLKGMTASMAAKKAITALGGSIV